MPPVRTDLRDAAGLAGLVKDRDLVALRGHTKHAPMAPSGNSSGRGAALTGFPGHYPMDEEHIARYLKSSRDPAAFEEYLKEQVFG